MEQKTTFEHGTAVKITIKKILEGELKWGEDVPSHLLVAGQKIYRLNLMATLLNKEEMGNITNFVLDDGTGQITLRFFEVSPILSSLGVGEVVLVIGKVRKYNAEKYVSADLIKKVDPLWLKLRREELKNIWKNFELGQNSQPDAPLKTELDPPTQKIIQLVKNLDSGSGVCIEEVVEKSLVPRVEQIISKMLQSGVIFQVAPGKIKIL